MKYEDVLVAKSDKEANENMPYIISFVCLVVILFFFVVIFHRKKSRNRINFTFVYIMYIFKK